MGTLGGKGLIKKDFHLLVSICSKITPSTNLKITDKFSKEDINEEDFVLKISVKREDIQEKSFSWPCHEETKSPSQGHLPDIGR